jgi:hypothetical protein
VSLILFQNIFLNTCCSWAPVAHACNPRYSGGRDQEDHGPKPARANSLQDSISRIPNTKTGLVEQLKQQECLLSKREALGSSLSAVEKIEKSKD